VVIAVISMSYLAAHTSASKYIANIPKQQQARNGSVRYFFVKPISWNVKEKFMKLHVY